MKVKPAPPARKHVSALRAEYGEPAKERQRIERRETADRGGRTVYVERLVSAKRDDKRQDKRKPPPDTRNGRRFEAGRRDRNDASERPARRVGGPAASSKPTKRTHDGGRVSKNQAGTLAKASQSTKNLGFRSSQSQYQSGATSGSAIPEIRGRRPAHGGKPGRPRAGPRPSAKAFQLVLARQDPMKSQGASDRQAAQNHLAGAGPEGAADPQKGALAANRDAPCALSAAG